jgi:hypothetical protein
MRKYNRIPQALTTTRVEKSWLGYSSFYLEQGETTGRYRFRLAPEKNAVGGRGARVVDGGIKERN